MSANRNAVRNEINAAVEEYRRDAAERRENLRDQRNWARRSADVLVPDGVNWQEWAMSGTPLSTVFWAWVDVEQDSARRLWGMPVVR